MKVLKILSSIMGEKSVSNKRVNEIAAQFQSEGHEVIERDVVENPVPMVDRKLFAGLAGDVQFKEIADYHNEIVDEVLDVDVLLISAPMYNFTVPTQLKAYFDAVTRAGKTFKYTDAGPVGLLKVQKAIVVISRGSIYSSQGFTAQEDFIKMFLKFVGTKQVEFQFIEGVALGADSVLKTTQIFDLA